MTALTITVLHGATGSSPDEIDTLVTAEAICDTLNRQGHRATLAHVSGGTLVQPWTDSTRPDLVFNMVEAIDGSMARAAEVPLMLEALGIPFTGCRSGAHLATATKTGQKRLMATRGLPTPAWSFSGNGLDPDGRVIVKSVSEHASIGMDAQSVVPTARAADEITNREGRFGGMFFAEAYIPGREFNLSLIETPQGVEVLPPAEILFEGFDSDAPHIVDYAAKWDEESFAYTHTPRKFDFSDKDQSLLLQLADLSRQAWQVFDLSGYARVDFRVDATGAAWILEVNTNPCLAPDAGFAAAAAQAGLSFDTVIARLVASAVTTENKDIRHVSHPQDC